MAHAHGWYHGPKGWAISTALGIVAGVVLALAVPGGKSTHAAAHDAAHGETVVVQIGADGQRLRRLADLTTVEEEADAAPTPAPRNTEAQPPQQSGHGGAEVKLWMVAPFALLLASIALMPFINERFWHAHYADVALFLGGLMAAYYVRAFAAGGHGQHAMLHAGIEYYSFIALIGGLYVVSGGVFVNIKSKGTPLTNTLLLAVGAVIANVVGTTGASMLLIRPFMRMNTGRLHAMHVVMFIFIVSNCGGCLTPIGDPPLYLGFLKGVPFEWTIIHMWPMWLACIGMLLVVFYVIDTVIGPAGRHSAAKVAKDASAMEPPAVEAMRREIDAAGRSGGADGKGGGLINGWGAIGMLALLVAAVFIDPAIKAYGLFDGAMAGIPVGASVQIVVAVAAYFMAPKWIHKANGFTFMPVKEVGFLFVGIFATMVPALEYLAANGSSLGLETPTQFYFGTGSLSGVLDNAPTYLNFVQTAFGVLHLPLTEAGIHEFIASSYEVTHPPLPNGSMVRYEGQLLLEAISLGAVFFGAMTYIGNGPNFMVKAIAESSGVKMPSFFGYLILAVMILLPVLVGVWALFIAPFAVFG